MAAKSKTPRKRPVKRSGKKERSPAFLLVVIVVAVVAIAVSYFYLANTSEEDSDGFFSPVTSLFTTQSDSTKPADESLIMPDNEAEKAKTLPAEKIEKTIIEGTWVSTLNGAMLSFEGNRFKLEFPSVEKRALLEGHFKIMGGEIHLVNTLSDDLCGMENGIYSFSIKGEDLILKSENDPCKMRKENLSTDWFKL